MPYQRGANPLALIFVDKPEGDLGLARFDDDIAAAADQGRAPVVVRDRDQRDMFDEVDVEEIVGLFPGNLPLTAKKRKWSVSALVRASAARQPSRSSGRWARIMIVPPLRNVSVAE